MIGCGLPKGDVSALVKFLALACRIAFLGISTEFDVDAGLRINVLGQKQQRKRGQCGQGGSTPPREWLGDENGNFDNRFIAFAS